jgi:hypothetical protein
VTEALEGTPLERNLDRVGLWHTTWRGGTSMPGGDDSRACGAWTKRCNGLG